MIEAEKLKKKNHLTIKKTVLILITTVNINESIYFTELPKFVNTHLGKHQWLHLTKVVLTTLA